MQKSTNSVNPQSSTSTEVSTVNQPVASSDGLTNLNPNNQSTGLPIDAAEIKSKQTTANISTSNVTTRST